MSHAPRLPTFRLIDPRGTMRGFMCHFIMHSRKGIGLSDHCAAREKNGHWGTNMPPVMSSVTNHPPSASTECSAPVPDGAWCGAAALNRRRWVQKMFPSPFVLKQRSLIVARYGFPIRNSHLSPPRPSSILLVSKKSPSRWFVNTRVVVSPTKPLRPSSYNPFC